MKIIIKDCNLNICRELDKWLACEDIVNHAMFDQTFTEEYNYYQNNKLDEIVYQKVIFIDDILIGYVVLMYYVEHGKYEVSFNPFIINPNYQNKGYGKMLLKYIIDNIELIVDGKVDYLVASISIQNMISIRLFESLKFIKIGESADLTYIYYKLKNDS